MKIISVTAISELNSVAAKGTKSPFVDSSSAKMAETIDNPTAVVEIPHNRFPGSNLNNPTGAPGHLRDPTADPRQQTLNGRQPPYSLRGVNPLLRAPLPRINFLNIQQRNGMVLRMPVVHVMTRNFRNQLVPRALPIYTIREGKVFFSTVLRQRYPQVIARVQQLEAQGVALKPTLVRPEVNPTALAVAAARKQKPTEVVDRMTETTEPLTGVVEAGVVEGAINPNTVAPVADPIQDTIYPAEKKMMAGESAPIDSTVDISTTVDPTAYEPTTESTPVLEEQTKKQKKEPNMNEFPFVLTTRGGNTPIDAITGLPLNQPFPENFVLPTFGSPSDLPPVPSDLLREGSQ